MGGVPPTWSGEAWCSTMRQPSASLRTHWLPESAARLGFLPDDQVFAHDADDLAGLAYFMREFDLHAELSGGLEHAAPTGRHGGAPVQRRGQRMDAGDAVVMSPDCPIMASRLRASKAA